MPTNTSQYQWVQADLVGMVSFFGNTQNLEDAYRDVGHVSIEFSMWWVQQREYDAKTILS